MLIVEKVVKEMLIVEKMVKDMVKHIELKSSQLAMLEKIVLRKKESVNFATKESEDDMSITTLKNVIAALVKGMAGDARSTSWRTRR
eukprot:11474617-Heterocapsa_arctica.AAC.1